MSIVEKMEAAYRQMVCARPVGAGDSNTYTVEPPTRERFRKAVITATGLTEQQLEGLANGTMACVLAGNAASDVLAERQRQQSDEGWTPEHDDQHDRGELATAARSYAAHATNYAGQSNVGYRLSEPPSYWPWVAEWWKPKDRRRDFVKAAALILAEIERLDRAMLAAKEG